MGKSLRILKMISYLRYFDFHSSKNEVQLNISAEREPFIL